MSSDTRIENPLMAVYAHSQSVLVNEWAKQKRYPDHFAHRVAGIKAELLGAAFGQGLPAAGEWERSHLYAQPED